MKPETHACLERVPFFLFCTGSEKPRTVIANRKCTPTRDSVVPLVGRLPRRGLRGRFRRARQSVHGARKLESLPCGQAGENVYCNVVRVVLPSFLSALDPRPVFGMWRRVLRPFEDHSQIHVHDHDPSAQRPQQPEQRPLSTAAVVMLPFVVVGVPALATLPHSRTAL